MEESWKVTLPAGCLGGSIRWQCRCWGGRCKLRWIWLDGWTECLSSAIQRHHDCECNLPNTKFRDPMEKRWRGWGDWWLFDVQHLRIILPFNRNSLHLITWHCSFIPTYWDAFMLRAPCKLPLVHEWDRVFGWGILGVERTQEQTYLSQRCQTALKTFHLIQGT